MSTATPSAAKRSKQRRVAPGSLSHCHKSHCDGEVAKNCTKSFVVLAQIDTSGIYEPYNTVGAKQIKVTRRCVS